LVSTSCNKNTASETIFEQGIMLLAVSSACGCACRRPCVVAAFVCASQCSLQLHIARSLLSPNAGVEKGGGASQGGSATYERRCFMSCAVWCAPACVLEMCACHVRFFASPPTNQWKPPKHHTNTTKHHAPTPGRAAGGFRDAPTLPHEGDGERHPIEGSSGENSSCSRKYRFSFFSGSCCFSKLLQKYTLVLSFSASRCRVVSCHVMSWHVMSSRHVMSLHRTKEESTAAPAVSFFGHGIGRHGFYLLPSQENCV